MGVAVGVAVVVGSAVVVVVGNAVVVVVAGAVVVVVGAGVHCAVVKTSYSVIPSVRVNLPVQVQ